MNQPSRRIRLYETFMLGLGGTARCIRTSAYTHCSLTASTPDETLTGGEDDEGLDPPPNRRPFTACGDFDPKSFCTLIVVLVRWSGHWTFLVFSSI